MSSFTYYGDYTSLPAKTLHKVRMMMWGGMELWQVAEEFDKVGIDIRGPQTLRVALDVIRRRDQCKRR